MSKYMTFASIYDTFMDNIPYEDWIKYIVKILDMNNIKDGTIIDLACGTGNISIALSKLGYEMIGVDLSYDMLNVAYDKTKEQGLDIIYLNKDMRNLNIDRKAKAVISICDSINYLLNEDDILKTFKSVKKALNENEGIFIFDLNTIYYYQEVLGDNIMAENKDNASIIWENTYYREDNINEIFLTMFVLDSDNTYSKFEEEHIRRAYSIEDIEKLIYKAGFNKINIYDGYTLNKVHEKSERICFIVK